MYLITKWFGTFLCDKNGIRKSILFPKEEEEIVKRLKIILDNDILPEERKIVQDAKVIVNERRLSKIGYYDEKDPFFKKVSIKPSDYGYTQELLQRVSIKVTKASMEERLNSRDLQIIQMVNALDELIHTSNLLSERLACWSSIPTSKEKVDPLKRTLSCVKEEIKKLEEQIEKDMSRVAFNLSEVVGPLIGARLISLAGGLEKLAVMPASTIQILGAEKALFRFKKSGGKPPKHGVIFQHPLINRSPLSERGKIARMLSAKIATAVRADVFTRRNIANLLKEEMNIRIKELR